MKDFEEKLENEETNKQSETIEDVETDEQINISLNVENIDKNEINDVEKEVNAEEYNKEKKPTLIERIKKYKAENNKKFYIILTSIILTIVALLSVIIPVSINSKRKSLYSTLTYEMLNFDNESLYEIESLLNQLPNNYKNVEDIKIQFNAIKKHTNMINDYWTSSTGYGLDENKSQKTRTAYIQLTLINQVATDWDLSGYIKDIKLEKLIFGIEWKSISTTHTFEWENYEDSTDRRLLSSIPSDKETGKEYYFNDEILEDSIIFGYENKEYSNDNFKAFKVNNFRYTDSKFYIDVYCYTNDTKYIFTIDSNI